MGRRNYAIAVLMAVLGLRASDVAALRLDSTVGDHRLALLYSSVLFLPAAGVALLLWEPPDEQPAPTMPVE